MSAVFRSRGLTARTFHWHWFYWAYLVCGFSFFVTFLSFFGSVCWIKLAISQLFSARISCRISYISFWGVGRRSGGANVRSANRRTNVDERDCPVHQVHSTTSQNNDSPAKQTARRASAANLPVSTPGYFPPSRHLPLNACLRRPPSRTSARWFRLGSWVRVSVCGHGF